MVGGCSAYLSLSVVERQCEPGHFAEVFRERRLVPVRADEDDLEAVAELLSALGVELGELRREAATRGTPVRREVEA